MSYGIWREKCVRIVSETMSIGIPDPEVINILLESEHPLLAAVERAPASRDLILAILKENWCPGRDLEERFYRDRALLIASHRGDYVTAGILLEAGANPNCVPNTPHNPLWVACYTPTGPLVRTLLDYGAMVKTPSGWLYQPLVAAITGGDESTVRLLLSRGALVTRESVVQATLLDRPDILRSLLAIEGLSPELRAVPTELVGAE